MTKKSAIKVRLRPAIKGDAATIAKLYSISSDGGADYIWTKLATEGEDILAVGAKRYARDDNAFSYQNCTVAEENWAIAGMMVVFPMAVDENAVPESDPILAPYDALEEDNSFYICGVALFPDQRDRGIGGRFLKLAENKARIKGYNKVSLIVFDLNVRAKLLYERLGYREVARATTQPHPLIHYTGDALLLVKVLS